MDQSLIAYFEKYLSPFLLPNNWKLKSALLIGIITVLLASPRIHMMNEYIHSDSGLWTVIMRKSSDLTDPLKDIPAASHAAKKKLRLTVPAIAKVLHTGPWGIYLIQFILGFFSIFFFLSIIDRITANRLYSFLFAASFAFIFAGKCAFVDIAGHLDAWPFFFALLAIFTRFRLIQLISLFAVIWSDERGYILAAITCISLFVIENYGNEQESKPHKLNFGSLIPALSIPFAIALRMYLTGNYDLGTNYMDPANEVGSELLFNQIEQRFFISALMQFEGFWILFFTTIVILYKQRLFFPAILFA
ncbi:MAG: hypothetical protein KDC13_08330, partial [Bacteroidetes bacterium]|nr:hypothetical protein [Bacteroidota bacterium]